MDKVKYYKYAEQPNEDGTKVYLVAAVVANGTQTMGTTNDEGNAKKMVDALNAALEAANETPADKVERMLNQFGGRQDCMDFVNEMLSMHRTLNQKFTGEVIIPFVKEMAARFKGGRYDGRNEVACEFCSVMWDGIMKAKPELAGVEWHLPMI